MRGGEAGAALLEVMAAITLLAVAGVAAVSTAAEAGRAVERARDADRGTREAGAFLDAVALWTRDDLDRRLGERPQGRWKLHVDRPDRELYTVVLADSLTGAEILRTALFRPEAAHARP